MKRKLKGFTLAELILVMVLIAFLWTFAVKVINKNMENKVKVYIYNIYNELQYAGKEVNKKLLINKNENLNDILLKTNAINYCDAFVSNTNTYNAIDCVQGTSEFMVKKDVNPDIVNKYTCKRSYKYNVSADGFAQETYEPTKSEFIRDVSPYAGVYQELINDSAKSGNKYYSCTKTTEEIPKGDETEAAEFNLDQRLTNQAFVSSNNVSFYFITTSSLIDDSYTETDVYNYSADVYQDAICNVASTGSSNSDSYKKLFIFNTYNAAKRVYGDDIYSVKFGSATENNVGIFLAQRNVSSCGEAWANIKKKIPADLYNKDRCKTFFNLFEQYGNKQCCVYAYTNEGDKVWRASNTGGYWQSIGCHKAICQTQIPCVQMPSAVKDPNASDANNFYIKWKKYFETYFSNNIFHKDSVILTNVNEGTENKKIKDYNGVSSLTYPNHFIYVAIDNSFRYGTYGKDVFAFEHFGSKIIPVGVLAYQEDSPLKFNVITRDNITKKLERLNKEPVNFCEAMKYTGEKFSPYCECKDDSGNLVTQYINNVNPKCLKTFGCTLRPVNPSIVRLK